MRSELTRSLSGLYFLTLKNLKSSTGDVVHALWLPCTADNVLRILSQMNYSPQPLSKRRVPRFRLSDTTPALLEFQNGLRVAGELHVISRNGGLLFLPDAVQHGVAVRLTFRTHRGPVVGIAEMLRPVASTRQPFRFLALEENDQRTLHKAFESGLYRNIDEEERIEELRAVVANALANFYPPCLRRHFAAKLAIAVVALALCVAAWASSAFAAPQKIDLSPEFSQAAIKYLTVVANYDSAAVSSSSTAPARIKSAYDEMARMAREKTSPENLTALLLKIFADVHVMNLKTSQLTGDRKDVLKDETCISDWKQTLQSRSSNQPETCR